VTSVEQRRCVVFSRPVMFLVIGSCYHVLLSARQPGSPVVVEAVYSSQLVHDPRCRRVRSTGAVHRAAVDRIKQHIGSRVPAGSAGALAL
jgi:hypothetical protein